MLWRQKCNKFVRTNRKRTHSKQIDVQLCLWKSSESCKNIAAHNHPLFITRMPKPRLLNNTNNHFDDKELLIPNQHDKKASETSASYHQKPQNSSTVDMNGTTSATTATSLNRSGSRSLSKRPVSSTASSAANVKPNTILSLEDRDIVVIDNADYKESTSNEATVIVVEKPRKLHQKSSGDIDLAELLTETNWPASAGDLALALNNRSGGPAYNFSSGSTSTSNSSISCHQATGTSYSERNRSKNPLSHIGQSKVTKRNASSNTNNFVTTGNLINLDSDGSSASGSFELNSSELMCGNGLTAARSNTERIFARLYPYWARRMRYIDIDSSKRTIQWANSSGKRTKVGALVDKNCSNYSKRCVVSYLSFRKEFATHLITLLIFFQIICIRIHCLLIKIIFMEFKYYDNDHIPLTVLEYFNGTRSPPAARANGFAKGSLNSRT